MGNERIIGSIFCQENSIAINEIIEDIKKAGEVCIIEIRHDTKEGSFEPHPDFYMHGLEVISTCMTIDEGGYFDSTLEQWKELLKLTIDYGTQYIMIGLGQAETEQGKELIQYAKERNVKVIIGVHSQKTPSAIAIITTLLKIREAGADIAKVAYIANKPKDVIEVMKASLYNLGIPKIMIAMGKFGKFWRAVNLIHPWNCWGMFASIKEATAPGQLSVKDIKDILKILK
ncbi:MAG TPA: type I 3-dehydroquinate dehydratase [bacterium]|nr:type I 3-dehydroquinate dehydratase [bacterium]